MAFQSISGAARWDITIEQGATFSRTIQFEDIDVNDFDFRGEIRRYVQAPDAEAEFDFEKVDEDNLTIELSASTTADLPTGTRLVYDIEMHYTDEDDEERVIRLLEGYIRVKPEVTR